MALTIIIGTKDQVFKTIGYVTNYFLPTPCVYFKIGQRKLAIEELTQYYNKFQSLLDTGIVLTEEEWDRFTNQFEAKAKAKAMEIVNYLRKQPKATTMKTIEYNEFKIQANTHNARSVYVRRGLEERNYKINH